MVAGDYVNPDSHVESDSAIPPDTGLDIEDTVLRDLHSSTWLGVAGGSGQPGRIRQFGWPRL